MKKIVLGLIRPQIKLLLTLIQIFLPHSVLASVCPVPREVIDYPHAGMYHRIHPSGNFFLFTEKGRAVIVDVTDRKNPTRIISPLQDESYPVEAADGGWRMIASPVNGGARGPQGGMSFYGFNDLVSKQNRAKASFTDENFGQWYHSVAELPGSDQKNKKIRMLLFTDLLYKDYDVKMVDEQTIDKANSTEPKRLCHNIFGKPIKTFEQQQAFARGRREISQLEAEISKLILNGDDSGHVAIKQEQIQKRRIEVNTAMYGDEYAQNELQIEALEEQFDAVDKQMRRESSIANARTRLSEAENQRDLLERVRVRQDPAVIAVAQRAAQILQRFQAARDPNTQRQLFLEYEEAFTELAVVQGRVRDTVLAGVNSRIEQARAEFEVAQSKSPFFQDFSRLTRELRERRAISRRLRDGLNLQNPSLSKDGTFVAGLVEGTIRVYKINDNGTCEQVADTKHRGSKVSFSYPEKGKLPKITYTAEGGPSGNFQTRAFVYDLETSVTSIISTDNDRNPYYPGFTRDGRVMFKTSTGMTLVDPSQVNGNSPQCAAAGRTNRDQNQQDRKDESKAPEVTR